MVQRCSELHTELAAFQFAENTCNLFCFICFESKVVADLHKGKLQTETLCYKCWGHENKFKKEHNRWALAYKSRQICVFQPALSRTYALASSKDKAELRGLLSFLLPFRRHIFVKDVNLTCNENVVPTLSNILSANPEVETKYCNVMPDLTICMVQACKDKIKHGNPLRHYTSKQHKIRSDVLVTRSNVFIVHPTSDSVVVKCWLKLLQCIPPELVPR